MEGIYETLKNNKQNTVDGIITYLKEKKIIEASMVDKVRQFFQTSDKNNVNEEQFKEAMGKIAAENKSTVEDLAKSMQGQAQNRNVAGAAKSGMNALKNAF